MSTPSRQTSIGQHPSNDPSPGDTPVCAVDIPGAKGRRSHDTWHVSISSRDGSFAAHHAGESRSLGAALFGSLSGAIPTSLSYGASPGGYGVGHLMRTTWKTSQHSLPRMSSPTEQATSGGAAETPAMAFGRGRAMGRGRGEGADVGEQSAVGYLPKYEEENIGSMDSREMDLEEAMEEDEYEAYVQSGAVEELLNIPLLQQDAAAAAAAAAATAEQDDVRPADEYVEESNPDEVAGASLIRAFVFGILNSVAGIPALIAYAAIVFKADSYENYIDPLCKLFFLSSALHQTAFCLVSKLPFAVGQVQDVGIIFLSSMASSIASLVLDSGKDVATAVGTSLLTMTFSTLIVGALTLLVAHKSWARFISFIPLPVMGGYLSFVGYFCIASGVGLGTSVDISGPLSWGGIFHRLPLLKLIPTVGSCVAIMTTLQKAKHPLALPSVLIFLVGIFHIVRLILDVSLVEAEKTGWVMPPAAENVQFWKLYKLYNLQDGLSGIAWHALLSQTGKMVGLVALVIFGSAMDILAIQADVEGKINIDRELMTVGISNVATGALGVGFPGSYIFSQTLVTLRAGILSRLNGWTVVVAELLAFALPFSIVSVVPNYFLGGLLLWFGVEISRDWLILSFTKLTHVEYALLLVTFFSVVEFGLEGGIGAGILAAAVYFTYAYSESQIRTFSLARGRLRSSVVRSLEQQEALSFLWSERTAAARVQGFVFFGSAHGITSKIHAAAESLKHDVSSRYFEACDLDEIEPDELRNALAGHYNHQNIGMALNKSQQASAALAEAPRFLIIDWSRATGCDASGARTIAGCLREVTALGVTPVLTATHHHGIDVMLSAHGAHLAYMKWPPELHAPNSDLSPLDEYGEEVLAARSESYHGVYPGGSDTSKRRHDGTSETKDNREESSNDVNENTASYFSPRHRDDRGVPIIEPDVCLIFDTLEEGLRYCEDVYLQVAVRFGLCTPSTHGLTLEDFLKSHLEVMALREDEDPGVAALMAAAELQRFMGEAVYLRKGELVWDVLDSADDMYIVERGVLRVDELRRVEEGDYAPSRRLASVRSTSHGTSFSGLRQSAVPSLTSPNDKHQGQWKLLRSYELGAGCLAGTTDFFLGGVHATRCRCVSGSARVMRLDRQGIKRAAAEAPAALNALQLAIMRANSSDLVAAAETNLEQLSDLAGNE